MKKEDIQYKLAEVCFKIDNIKLFRETLKNNDYETNLSQLGKLGLCIPELSVWHINKENKKLKKLELKKIKYEEALNKALNI